MVRKVAVWIFIVFIFTVKAHASGDPGIKLIENIGQWPEHVSHSAAIPGGRFFLQKDRMTYIFYDAGFLHAKHGMHIEENKANEEDVVSGKIPQPDYIRKHAFDVHFLNSNPNVRLNQRQAYEESYNYFVGNKKKHWVSNAKAYQEVRLNELYECIDFKLYSGDLLKYDLIVHPGGSTDDIRMGYDGLDQVYIRNGNLHLITSLNSIVEQAPYAFQVIAGDTVTVTAEFMLHDDDEVSFNFPEGYDSNYPLIIDPLLVFASFSGSQADNFGYTATFDDNGNLYSGGIVYSQGFPVTTGAYQEAFNGGEIDIGILKFDSTGSKLLYATYLGGSSDEAPHSLIVDKNGALIIFGSTSSEDFPTTGSAYDRTFNGGSSQPNLLGYLPYTNGVDIFLTKLDGTGGALSGSTFVGGTGDDGVILTYDQLRQNYGDEFRGDVTVDEDNSIYVASSSRSADFFGNASPGFVSFDSTLNGISDAVIFKMDHRLSSMVWGGFLGGGDEDAAFSLKTGIDKRVYVGGGTVQSADRFPTTSGSLHEEALGGIDGFAAAIGSNGLQVLNSTLIGTPDYDQVYFLDLDADENVYLFGQTRGSYPVTAGVYNNANSGQFIHKLNYDLSTTIFTTVFGSGYPEPNISPTAFLVNDCDNLYISGWGGSVNRGYSLNNGSTIGMPTTNDAFKKETDGSDIYMMSLTSDGTSLLYATFFGGSNNGGDHVDGGTNRFDKRGIIYQAVCSCGGSSDDFPVTPGAYGQVNRGVNEEGVERCNNAVFKFDLASLRARIQTNAVGFDQPGITSVCLPEAVVLQNISVGGESYEWELGDGTAITLSDTSHIVHHYKAPGNYTVKLRAIDRTTCIGEDVTTTTIQVHQPQFTVSDDATICFGESFKLNASGGTHYHWMRSDSTFVSNSSSPTVTPKDTTAYIVTMTDNNGCSAMDTVEVAVIPELALNFEAIKVHDCFSRPRVKLVNSTEGGEDFRWVLGDGNFAEGQELIYNYQEDGIYEISLEGTKNSCVFQKRVKLNIQTVKVPNVITPGLPEHNDAFEIIANNKVNLMLFNRWGRMVYKEDDYKNTWKGEGNAAGIYYYEADIEDEVVCRGWLHLIK